VSGAGQLQALAVVPGGDLLAASVTDAHNERTLRGDLRHIRVRRRDTVRAKCPVQDVDAGVELLVEVGGGEPGGGVFSCGEG
jgi:hypothetical protein